MLVDMIRLLRDELPEDYLGSISAVFMDISNIAIVRAAPADTGSDKYNLIVNQLGFPMRDKEAAVRAAQLVVDQAELARDRQQIEAQERLLALQKPLAAMLRDAMKDE